MFAHLRSRDGVLAKYQFLLEFISKQMRTNVCANVSPLTGLDPSNEDVAKMLAEIHMREFACIMKTLDQVHGIAARYHEDAFDNTDAYIGLRFVQLPPHEMTGEQRHASRLLLEVGQSHSEINAALKSIGLSRGDIMGHDSTKMSIVSEQFQDAQTVAEDAFGRLHHMSKKVWSLVNMLAFSNLFRFADPRQPICIPNPDDAIFIPRIPMQQTPMHEDHEDHEEQEPDPKPEEELSLRAATLAPFVNVSSTDEAAERNTKSRAHKFGRCEYCDAGLDDRADFICHTHTNVGFALMCNACHEQRNPGRASP